MLRKLTLLFAFTALLDNCKGPAKSESAVVVDAPPAVEASKTAVVLLVDISQSFAPLTREDRDALNVVISDLVLLAQKRWDSPVTFYWSTITGTSLYATPPCGAAKRFHPRLVARESTATDITRVDLLTAWMQECATAVIKRSTNADPFTDISGAVQLAAESNRAINGQRIILIYSDFSEDLAPGAEPTKFSLGGDTAVLLYRPDATKDRSTPNGLFDRLKQWEQRLKESGAKAVCVRPIRGIISGSVAGCFS